MAKCLKFCNPYCLIQCSRGSSYHVFPRFRRWIISRGYFCKPSFLVWGSVLAAQSHCKVSSLSVLMTFFLCYKIKVGQYLISMLDLAPCHS
jgi:hypothetical protein